MRAAGRRADDRLEGGTPRPIPAARRVVTGTAPDEATRSQPAPECGDRSGRSSRARQVHELGDTCALGFARDRLGRLAIDFCVVQVPSEWTR